MVFDTEVVDDESGEYIRVFGYILDRDGLVKELQNIE